MRELSVRVRNVIVPPCGMASTALKTRLVSAFAQVGRIAGGRGNGAQLGHDLNGDALGLGLVLPFRLREGDGFFHEMVEINRGKDFTLPHADGKIHEGG